MNTPNVDILTFETSVSSLNPVTQNQLLTDIVGKTIQIDSFLHSQRNTRFSRLVGRGRNQGRKYC